MLNTTTTNDDNYSNDNCYFVILIHKLIVLPTVSFVCMQVLMPDLGL